LLPSSCPFCRSALAASLTLHGCGWQHYGALVKLEKERGKATNTASPTGPGAVRQRPGKAGTGSPLWDAGKGRCGWWFDDTGVSLHHGSKLGNTATMVQQLLLLQGRSLLPLVLFTVFRGPGSLWQGYQPNLTWHRPGKTVDR